MKKRRFFALLLALVMTLGTTTALAANGFTDVPADAYYAAAVDWALEKGVTTGKSAESFAPGTTVTRAEAATFLWRMAGEPEPTQTETFADVEKDANNSWYKTAVQWAVEKHITNGTDDNIFSPNVTCSRGMILTMLYRMQGSPWDAVMEAKVPENSEDMSLEELGNALVQSMVEGIRSQNALTDVKEGDYFEIPVIWAMMNGVLGQNQVEMGEGAAAVQPNAPCPRGEMVYFLYHASGDAPAPAIPGSVETGTIPETVVLDKDGVKITATGIETDRYGDPRLTFTIANSTAKALRIDMDEFYVNTYTLSPQVYIPVEDEDGFVFYADAVAVPEETTEFFVSLSALDDMGITSVSELEMKPALVEVKKSEDGYDYVDDFAIGGSSHIRTSLYTESASYDMEGTTVYDKNGLKLLVTKAANSEYSGPEITMFVYNGSKENVSLEIAGLKLDGVSYDSFFSPNVPAGKRYAGEISISLDFDNIPTAKEAELTFRKMDPETWKTIETFDSVKVTFAD